MAYLISSKNVFEYADRSTYRILLFQDDTNTYNKYLHEWIKDLIGKWKNVFCTKIYWYDFTNFFPSQKSLCNINDVLIVGCKQILDFVPHPSYSDLNDIFKYVQIVNTLSAEERFLIPSKAPSNKYSFFVQPYEYSKIQNSDISLDQFRRDKCFDGQRLYRSSYLNLSNNIDQNLYTSAKYPRRSYQIRSCNFKPLPIISSDIANMNVLSQRPTSFKRIISPDNISKLFKKPITPSQISKYQPRRIRTIGEIPYSYKSRKYNR